LKLTYVTYTVCDENVTQESSLRQCDIRRGYPENSPENWPTPSFHYSSCATLRSHLSNSWATVLFYFCYFSFLFLCRVLLVCQLSNVLLDGCIS